MEGELLTIKDGHGTIPAFWICPSDAKHAVILIEEVWGLNDNIVGISRRLAAHGYAVLAPDILAGTDVAAALTPQLAAEMANPQKRAAAQPRFRAALSPLRSPEFARHMLRKLKESYKFVKAHEDIKSISVMGFCFGGTYSFALAAEQHGLKACIVFYGHPPEPLDRVAAISCPVLAFYGDRDEPLMTSLPALTERMKLEHRDFTVKIYRGAGHAFFNDQNRAMYNAAAATDSWKLALAFLKTHDAT